MGGSQSAERVALRGYVTAGRCRFITGRLRLERRSEVESFAAACSTASFRRTGSASFVYSGFEHIDVFGFAESTIGAAIRGHQFSTRLTLNSTTATSKRNPREGQMQLGNPPGSSAEHAADG
jgi:hypothetical protein